MPPVYQPVPNTAQLELIYLQAGQRIENIYHFERSTPWDLTALNTLAVAAIAQDLAHLAPIRVAAAALVTVIARSLESAGAPAIEVPVSPQAGTNSGNGGPTNVTLAIKWVTGLAGRSYRGRTYHVGMSFNYVTGNVVTSAGASAMLSAYLAFKASLELTMTARMVVVSRWADLARRAIGVTTDITSAVIADYNLDSQRRRLTGRGA